MKRDDKAIGLGFLLCLAGCLLVLAGFGVGTFFGSTGSPAWFLGSLGLVLTGLFAVAGGIFFAGGEKLLEAVRGGFSEAMGWTDTGDDV